MSSKLKFDDSLRQADKRKRYNAELFTIVAPKYDFATRLLSFGQDARWKRRLIDGLPAVAAPRCLDIACGSGDLSSALGRRYRDGRVLGVDLTPGMIERARDRNAAANVEYLISDMCRLDAVPSGTIDIVTGGYALRNAQDLNRMLEEVSRVLKFGGFAAFLEFCNAENHALRVAHQICLHAWGGFCGLVLHGSPDVYRYIPRTLKLFPTSVRMSRLMSAVGIEHVESRFFFMGMMEISLWRKQRERSGM